MADQTTLEITLDAEKAEALEAIAAGMHTTLDALADKWADQQIRTFGHIGERHMAMLNSEAKKAEWEAQADALTDLTVKQNLADDQARYENQKRQEGK